MKVKVGESMSNCILYRHEFVIIKTKEGFIVYNTKKPFKDGHTHLQKFNSCITAIKLSERKQMPKSKSKYFINSLIRINLDEEYIDQLKELNLDFEQMMKNNSDVDNTKCL